MQHTLVFEHREACYGNVSTIFLLRLSDWVKPTFPCVFISQQDSTRHRNLHRAMKRVDSIHQQYKDFNQNADLCVRSIIKIL